MNSTGFSCWLVATCLLPALAFAQSSTSQSTDPYFSPVAQKTVTPRAADQFVSTARPVQSTARPQVSEGGSGTRTSGSATRPAPGSATRPAPGSATRPAPGSATRPASGSDSRQSLPGIGEESGLAETGEANSNQSEFEPGQVLAMVAGEPIFVADMIFETNQLLDRFMPGAPEEAKAGQRKAVMRRLLPKFIDSKILWLDAIRGLPEGADIETVLSSAMDEFDENAVTKVMKAMKVNSEIELDALLRAKGTSLRHFRRGWAQEQIMRFFMLQQLNIDGEIAHFEMLEYYNEHKESFHQKAQVRWEELTIHFDRAPSRSEAEQVIKALGNEVVYGAKFDAVAKKGSHGFTASKGGVHDWTNKGDLAATEVEQALFEIPPNQLSDVIESSVGLHIVRVLERKEEQYIPFRDAQIEIKKKIRNERNEGAFQKHLSSLYSRYPVEILLEDVELPERMADLEITTR